MGLPAKFIGRWVANGNAMQTGYPGSSFSFYVTGATAITIQISDATRIAYKLDDDDYQLLVISSGSVKIRGLSRDTHRVKVVICTSHTTWAGSNYATVSGISVDTGYIYAQNKTKKNILVFGDSITEGWCADNSLVSAPDCAWWNVLSDKLVVDITPVGMGGIGYTNKSNGGYPAVNTTPSYIENISSDTAVSDTNFDVILLELGVNDWKSKTEVDSDYVSTVETVLTRIKSKYSKSDIHALLPFNQNGWPSLKQAYEDAGVHVISTDWYSNISFYDELHPNRSGGRIIANQLKDYLVNFYGGSYFKEDVMKRIDVIYLDKNGAVQKVSSESADAPVAPAIPDTGIKISEVTVSSDSTNGELVDKRFWASRYYNADIVSVKDYGAKGDGTTDDTVAIQKAIDDNPLKDIIFPVGTYIISKPIITSATDSEKVRLFIGNATIKASSTFSAESYMITIGGKGTATYGYAPQHDTGVYGGILDGSSVADGGIHLVNLHQAHLENTVIKEVNKTGVYVDKPSTGLSSDAYVNGLMISGKSLSDSVGLKIDGYDNNIKYIRTSAFQKGIQLNGGGNFLTECHPLYNDAAFTDWDNSVGFEINCDNQLLEGCYSDNFRYAIHVTGNYRFYAHHFFAFWYSSGDFNACGIKYDGTTFCGVISDSLFQFPSGANKIGYDGPEIAERGSGFFGVKANNITNASTDKIIWSSLNKNGYNKNLIPNWDFLHPVNTSSKTKWTTSSDNITVTIFDIYQLRREQMSSADATAVLDSTGLKLTFGTWSSLMFNVKVPQDGPYTLSVKYKDSSNMVLNYFGKKSGHIPDGSGIYSITDTFMAGQKTLRVMNENNTTASITVLALKLEYGSESTIFRDDRQYPELVKLMLE